MTERYEQRPLNIPEANVRAAAWAEDLDNARIAIESVIPHEGAAVIRQAYHGYILVAKLQGDLLRWVAAVLQEETEARRLGEKKRDIVVDVQSALADVRETVIEHSGSSDDEQIEQASLGLLLLLTLPDNPFGLVTAMIGLEGEQHVE